MEEIILADALKKVRAHTCREDRTNLMWIRRPPKERNLLFQPDSLLAMRDTT